MPTVQFSSTVKGCCRLVASNPPMHQAQWRKKKGLQLRSRHPADSSLSPRKVHNLLVLTSQNCMHESSSPCCALVLEFSWMHWYMCARPLQIDDTPKSKDTEILSQLPLPLPWPGDTTRFSVLTYKFEDDNWQPEPQTLLLNRKRQTYTSAFNMKSRWIYEIKKDH